MVYPNKIKLALVAPNKNLYSETFVRYHREMIDAEVHFLWQGLLPEMSEEGSIFRPSLINKVLRKFYHIFFPHSLNIHERKVLQYLRHHKIEIIVAEWGMTGGAIMKVANTLDIPLIVFFHGFDAYSREALEKYSFNYRELFKQASNVFAVSKHMYQHLICLGCQEEKLLLNPFGPPDSYFDATSSEDSRIFLSVGRLVEKKGPHYTIRAFQKVVGKYPDAKLVMIGDGVLMPRCIQLVKELGLAKNVIFLGPLDQTNVLKWNCKSVALVQHSMTAKNGDSEGTPLSILEAGACGLPVVATRHAGIPDAVLEGITGILVDEGDIEGMARGMIQILDDPAGAKKMGQAARVRIREYFTLERHMKLLNDCIERAVDLSKQN